MPPTRSCHQGGNLGLWKSAASLNLWSLEGYRRAPFEQMFGPDIEVRFRGSYFNRNRVWKLDVFFGGLAALGCVFGGPCCPSKWQALIRRILGLPLV
jgi:hypothetical protein